MSDRLIRSPNIIHGMGKDAPKVVNDQGGSQSLLPYRFDLIDPQAIFALAEVLYQGSERHGEDNWRKIPINDHLNHALAHIYAYMAGDEQDDHLGHAFCRMMFAVALEKRDVGNKECEPKDEMRQGEWVNITTKSDLEEGFFVQKNDITGEIRKLIIHKP